MDHGRSRRRIRRRPRSRHRPHPAGRRLHRAAPAPPPRHRLTHAHEDHIGAVRICGRASESPVYCTPFAAACSRTSSRRPARRSIAVQHRCTPGARFDARPFDIEFVAVAHSIPEADALAMRTPLGTRRAHRRLEDRRDAGHRLGRSTRSACARSAPKACSALVCDSTNVLREGRARRRRTSPRPDRAHRGSDGPRRRHHFRVQRRAHLAPWPMRRRRADARSWSSAAPWSAPSRSRANAAISMALPTFLSAGELRLSAARQDRVLCTGSQGEPRAALARIAARRTSGVKLAPGDRVIFSSRTIPGNEKGVGEILNGLIDAGRQVLTVATGWSTFGPSAPRRSAENVRLGASANRHPRRMARRIHLSEHATLRTCAGRRAGRAGAQRRSRAARPRQARRDRPDPARTPGEGRQRACQPE